MKKMIAGLMILLMTMSVIPLQSGEENDVLKEEFTSFYANGPEMELVSLNTISNGSLLYNGDVVPFNVLIANSGTTFIYDVSVTVEIWEFDQSSATNETGNLPYSLINSWTSNPVCNDDADGDGNPDCPYQIVNPSDVIDDGSGSYTLPGVTWSPDVGMYMVRVYLTVDDDTDLTNNMIQVSVAVLEWFDVSVSTVWIDSPASVALDMGATPGGHDFKTVVSVTSSAGAGDYSLRNVSVSLEVTGGSALTDAHLNGGNATSTGTSFYVGSPSEIMIDQIGFFDPEAEIGIDSENGTEMIDSRWILPDRTDFEITGAVNTTGAEGAIHITATLVSYSVYDSSTPLFECISGFDQVELCEATGRTSDIDANNNHDSIHAYNGVVHDVQLNSLVVRSPAGGEISSGSIGVGNHTITVNASHTGSDPSQHYYVNVSVEMADGLGNVLGTFGPFNTCQGDPITLGSPEEPTITQMSQDICFNLDFYPGTMVMTITLTLDDGGTDEYLVNNVITSTFEVFNEDPVAHLILEPQDDLLVGSNVFMYGFSVDSDNYLYDFSYTFYRVDGDMSETLIECTNKRDNSNPNCSADIDSLWINTAALKVVVEDYYGGIGSTMVSVNVWATETISDLDDTFVYSMVYKSSSAYVASVSQSQNMIDQDLPMIPGKHDTLSVWDYSTTSDAPLINRHELVLTYPRSADGDGTLWYMADGSSVWESVGDSAVSYTGQTTQTIRWTDIDGSEDPIASGKYAVFATDAGAPPTVAVNGLKAVNTVGGGIQLSWNIVGGSFEAEDRLVISYSSGGTNALDGADAATYTIDTDSVLTWRLPNALHGQMYYFLLCVENDNGANTAGCDDTSIEADSMVSPVPTISNLNIEAVGETQLKISWEATQTEDVDHWDICMGMSSASTNQCFSTTGPVTEKVLSKPTQQVRWFFNIYAIDDAENNVNVGTTNIDLSDPSALDPGVGGPVLGSVEEGQVPMWAFGLIGAVVVLSIIIGAVIISRGGGDDDDDQWDY